MIPTEPGEGGAGTGRYRFGDVVVDEAAHTVLRAGCVQPVEPKAFAVLLALLQRPGELIARDDLLDRVWGHRHVTPGVLTRAIAQLRHALDDDSQRPRYIVTQHALGYRFIGALQAEPGQGFDAATTETSGPGDAVESPVADGSRQDGSVGDAGLSHAQVHRPVAIERRQPPPVRTRQFSWWAAAALLLGIVATSWLWSRRPVAPPVPGSASIAILPFTSLGADRKDDYFAEGLAVEMHDALAGVQGLKVAAQMTPKAAGRDADVKAIGQRLGVAAVLDASVRRAGSRMRINARLSDTATGYTLWSRTYDREMTDVFATQSEIANEVVRSLLGVLPGRREILAERLAPTTSVAAFDAYLKGLRQLRLSAGDGDVDHAIGFFSQALAADGGFVRAQIGICRSELSRFEALRNADAFGRAHAACLRAEKMNPRLGEVNLALGELHRVRGEPGKAIEYYAKVEGNSALMPDVNVGMAKTHAAQGRQDLALDYFERARALRPSDASIQGELGYQQYLAGNLPEAIEAYRSAANLRPDDADLWSSLGGLYLSAGNNAAAGKAFERSIAIAPSDAVLSNYGALKYQAGDYAAAATLFRRAIALDAGDFLIWGYLGEALLAQPATAGQARKPFLRAAEMAQRYVEIKPDDAKALAALGWYRANLGERSRARELVVRSEALGTERGEVAVYNAQTLMAIGSESEALKRVASARQAGIPDSRIETNAFLRQVSLQSQSKQTTVPKDPPLDG
jgi:TolB-like protein/DNA-binding winged helix-turn-helix (wHTH) protein/Flp pilus assembly protein TadD